MMRSVAILLALFVFSSALAADERENRLRLRWIRSKPPISAVTIDGNQYFSDGDIRKRMYSRKRSLWSTLKGDRRTRIQRESLGRDTLEIKYMYLTNGFLGIQAEERFHVIPADSSARIAVTINEGRQFRYGKITVTGSFDKRFAVGFHKIHQRLKEGEKISLFDLRRAVFDMNTVLANNGYPYAKVEYVPDTSNGTPVCPVTFDIQADSLVHFGEVTVKGVHRYPEYTVHRESKIKAADVYRRQTIIDSRRRLLESGYFSSVSIMQADDGTDRLNPAFILRVRERKPMYVTVKTGAGQSDVRDLEWDFSTGFGRRNFLGSRSYDLSARLRFGLGGGRGLLEHSYRIRFTEPWLLGTRMPLALAAEYEPGVKDPEQNYRIESWSLSATTVRKFGREMRITFGIEYESVRIYGVPAEEADRLKVGEGISVRRKTDLALRRDSRDNIFVPRRGSLTDLSIEYYGGFLGGDHNFTKLEASWSSYQVVWPGWISATRFKSGWTQPFFPSKEVPKIDRFYLGGANTIRGFRVNSLGPTLEDGTLEKANFIALFNQEFRWQTIQVFQFVPFLKDLLGPWPLWQSVFFDMGNGFSKVSEMSLARLAYSYGTGIQIVSPAGPIRIDYARRIKTKTIDFDYRWHFTILYAF